MKSTATAPSPSFGNLFLSPAIVIEGEQDDGMVRVRMDAPGPLPISPARVAVLRTAPLKADDRVLITGDSNGELYVIGVIWPCQPATETPTVLRTNNGAYAALSCLQQESERVQVYSPRNELVFEYDPVGEKARVSIAHGCLELRTEDGDIELQSAQDVRIEGRTIEMNSHGLNVKAASARWIVDRMETLAGTLVEKARNSYRTVEQLAQLRTGRMRTLVNQTFQFKSRKAFLKSEEDFKIKGEKIHLG